MIYVYGWHSVLETKLFQEGRVGTSELGSRGLLGTVGEAYQEHGQRHEGKLIESLLKIVPCRCARR